MVGALFVHVILYRLILRRKSPLFATSFQIPTRRDITLRLVMGSALFGGGWGLSGFCPGPAFTSLSGLGLSAAVFVGTMLVGMATFHAVERLRAQRPDKHVSTHADVGVVC